MLPKTHFLFGLIASLSLYLIFPEFSLLGIGLFFLSSFLIDFDHYLYFLYEKRSFNLKEAIKWFKEKKKIFENLTKKEKKKYIPGFYIFHGLEWVILFSILGFFVLNLFYFISAGITFHLILDYIEIFNKKRKIFKLSIIYDLIKFNKLKKL